MNSKVRTKDDLIRMIESLPDTWLPTKVIWWREPQTVAMVPDGEIREFHTRIEIELTGPIDVVDTSKK